MDYSEAIVYLEKSFGAKFKKGHELVREILNMYDNPHRKLKFIHVAGTNGKGSTCNMINNILLKEGYKVGLFTSPHLDNYTERIRINNIDIGFDEFSEEILLVKNLSEKLFGNTFETFSFFEIMVIVAFDFFYKNNVDFVVLETGMGGKTDSTNIIENPLVTVITSISYDHTEYLGNTLEKIAGEKAGIIKKNCPVVLYSQSKEVYNVIEDVCTKNNSQLFYLNDNLKVNILKNDLTGTSFSVLHHYFDYNNLKLKMLGNYQVNNACNTLLTIYLLKKIGIKITYKSIKDGLYTCYWPGRMELLNINKRLVILEGAHNLESTILLKNEIELLKKSNVVTILGILSDKDYEKMVSILTRVSNKVILTKPNSKRAVKPNNLQKYVNNNCEVIIKDDYIEAINKAFDLTNEEDIIIVTGSLYLIGDVRRYIKKILEV